MIHGTSSWIYKTIRFIKIIVETVYEEQFTELSLKLLLNNLLF